MRNFAWILLTIVAIRRCLARTTGVVRAVATGEDDRSAVTPARFDSGLSRWFDPEPERCCGICSQLILNPEVVVLLVAFGGNFGGQLNPKFLPTTTVIVIIVRLAITFLDHNAKDPTARQTISFDMEVFPEDWNPVPCSYTDNCTIFSTGDITMFAPPTVGGFAVLSSREVDEFSEDSDVTILSNAYYVRCKDDVLCDAVEGTAGALDFSGPGVVLGTVEKTTFNNGLFSANVFDDLPCGDGTTICGEPHMMGRRGQTDKVSGVDGGWYWLIHDDVDDIHVNIRLTEPFPIGYPHRQLITGLAVISGGHSLTVEVKRHHSVAANGCPRGISPCLADGGVRISVDGNEVDSLLAVSRMEQVADGIWISASNLPVECEQFGGDKIWARMRDETYTRTSRRLVSESFEEWVLRFDTMAAPERCAKYIADQGLADVQSNHAVFKIETPAVNIRLDTGANYQGDGEVDRDESASQKSDFWQMDVGFGGLSMDHVSLSGLLGETARPGLDIYGRAVMIAEGALSGNMEDYSVPTADGVGAVRRPEIP